MGRCFFTKWQQMRRGGGMSINWGLRLVSIPTLRDASLRYSFCTKFYISTSFILRILGEKGALPGGGTLGSARNK